MAERKTARQIIEGTMRQMEAGYAARGEVSPAQRRVAEQTEHAAYMREVQANRAAGQDFLQARINAATRSRFRPTS